MSDDLAAYLDDLIDGVAWASTGAEAARHIRDVLGWCPARQLDAAADDDPEMTIADVGAPCSHDPEQWVGRVEAGDPGASSHCSTATCAACLLASQGYVQAVTNRPASPLIPFERKRPPITAGFARAQMYPIGMPEEKTND